MSSLLTLSLQIDYHFLTFDLKYFVYKNICLAIKGPKQAKFFNNLRFYTLWIQNILLIRTQCHCLNVSMLPVSRMNQARWTTYGSVTCANVTNVNGFSIYETDRPDVMQFYLALFIIDILQVRWINVDFLSLQNWDRNDSR